MNGTEERSTRVAEVTTPTGNEIRIVREFDAPRDRVWAAYTDPELIPEWWGRRHSTTRVDAMDVREGGQWKFVEVADDGEFAFSGEYREVVAPERISQTFEWEGMEGHVVVETTVFEDLGEQTRITTTSVFQSTEDRDGMLAAGMEKGMNESLQRLDELLAKS